MSADRTAYSASPLPAGEVGSRSDPGERLSWLSSALPSGVVADHGVEDGEELAHHGREGELFGFSGGGQPLVERLEKGIVAAGDKGGHVEDTACLGAPPQVVRLPRIFPLSRLIG